MCVRVAARESSSDGGRRAGAVGRERSCLGYKERVSGDEVEGSSMNDVSFSR